MILLNIFDKYDKMGPNENNAEVIFDVQYITGASPVMGASFTGVGMWNRYFQSQGLAS